MTLPSLPERPEISQQPMIVDPDKLEYSLVPPDVAESYKQFEVSVSPYFKELPNNKLDELYKDKSLMDGYLLEKYGDQYTMFRDTIVSDLKKQLVYCQKQSEKYEKETVPQIDRINKALENYHTLLDRFNSSQVEMYDKMNKSSKKSMMEMMEADLREADDQCKQTVDEIMGIPGEVAEEELGKFIQKYKLIRQKYYLKKEKLSRMSEERVGEIV
ncbi:hypothetical protein FOA43_003169 [Brettanomyces nanus]|uniref:VPS37 C-terminal domain-containing protein n=1 Tax=Eeniella nana TaxID=13502 RepID=A0A875RVT6_EENNA|nr:uncharacterized protein FOA43_003169 [Brettanomyces nanus]QPG75807.1 hypothetical protein FOA43_003169 [Brettanomyces nanus]